MDMILAFVGGLGLFLLLLPFLPDNPSLPPPPLRKKECSRKKDYEEPVARRAFWEEGERINDLDSLLHSHLGNLLHGNRFNQFPMEDAPGETFQPLSTRADSSGSQPLEDMFITASSSLVSQAPSTEHFPPPMSPGLKTFPLSLGSQSPSRASSPPEASIPLGCLSLQPFSSPLPSPGPMASPPLLPDSSLALPQQDSSLVPLGTISPNSSPPSHSSFSSPVPAISTLGHSLCAISTLPECQEPPRALYHSSFSNSEAQAGHLVPQLPVTSFLADTTPTKGENIGSHFLNPDVQKVLEILITKKVELKICKNTKGEGPHSPLRSLGNMLKSLGKEQDPIMSQPFWKTKEEFPALPQLPYPKIFWGDHVQHTGSQFFWGLPVLHSESLVGHTRVPDASLEFSTILFNGLSNYVPARIQSNVTPQLYPPRPLVHHVAQPHTFTPALPSSQPPSVSQKQTQKHAPSLPNVPCCSPQARAWEVSSLKDQKAKKYPVSPTIQRQQHKYLMDPEENRGFPPVIKKSKVFSQPADKPGAIQKNKSSGKLPLDVIYFKIREQLEEHLQTRLMCGMPQKVSQSMDRKKDPGTRQVKENCGPSQTSMISDKSSQVIQKTISELPEISQVGKHSSNDLEKAPKDLLKGLEISPVNELESICDPKSPRKELTLLRSDSGNDPVSSPDKNHLEDSESICPTGKFEQTGGGIPVGIDHSTHTMDHACDRSRNSNIPIEPWDKQSFKGQEYGRNTQDLSVLEPGTKKMLETHLKSFCVRHRWGLAFKVIKAICILKRTKAQTSLLPQPAAPSSASHSSKADSTHQDSNLQEESSQSIPGENVKAVISVLKMQGPVTDHSLKSSMKSLSGDDCGSSEAVPTGQETTLTAQPNVYCTDTRVWCPDTVSRPGSGSIGASPISVMDRYPQERGGVVSRHTSHQVLTGKMNVGSPCSRDRDIQKPMETEVKKPLEWEVTKRASVMSPSSNLNVSPRNLNSLGPNTSLPSPRICTFQKPGNSFLDTQAALKKKGQDSATRVVLQDFATGEILQDSASEMPLTRDILASQAHLANTQGASTHSTSPSQGIVGPIIQDRISQDEKEPRISKLQDPQEIKSSTFGPPESGGGFVSPSKMVTSHPSPSQGICDLSGRDTEGQEQKESRGPKSQELSMSKSHIIVPPEKKGSFEKPKPGEKEERCAGRRGIGGQMPPPQVRQVRESTGSKPLLQSEKKMSPSEATIGNRVRNFLQNILPKKDRAEAEPLQKAKPQTVTQSGGLGTKGRVLRDTGSVEAHVLMTTVRRILKEKMSLHHEFSASKENLQKGAPQVDRWSSCHKNTSSPQQNRILSNMACGPQARPQRLGHVTNRSLSRDKASNTAFPPREPGPLPGHFHRRPMGAGASEPPVHCPRHCAIQRTVFPNQSHNTSHIRPGEKSMLSKPALSHPGRSYMGQGHLSTEMSVESQ
nr:spermatogenesis-associated protein 31E1-like [Cavia porcellus]